MPVTFTAGPRQYRVRPNEVVLAVDWQAAVETARRQGDGFAPVRGLRRLGHRFFGGDVTPPARAYDDAADPQARCARQPDRSARAPGGRPPEGAPASGRPGRHGADARPGCRGPDDDDLADRLRAGTRRAPGRDHTARGDRRRPGAGRLAGRDSRLGPGPARSRRDALAHAAVADRTAAPAAAQRRHDAHDRRPQGQRLLRALSQERRPAAAGRCVRGLRQLGRRQALAAGPRPRCRRCAEGDPRRRALTDRADGASRRREDRARADDARGAGDGDHGPRRRLHHHLRRRTEPAAQRPARRAARRRRADRARRGVLVQPDDGRAHARARLPRGAGDHQRRAPERDRRRCLPGLHDGLQRGVRRRPLDHVAHEPRALHLALPAGPRRHRQLSRTPTCASRTTRTSGCSCVPSSGPRS